jgi:membrane protease YdiL (CAAX protease family)
MERNLIGDKNPFAQLALSVAFVLMAYLFLSLILVAIAKVFYGIEITQLESFIISANPKNIHILRFFQIIQTLIIFFVPSLLLAFIFSAKFLNYLHLEKPVKFNQVIIIVLLMLSALPLINLLGYLNQQMQFPSSLQKVEEWMMNMEKTAEKQTLAFMSTTTIKGLALNIFMIGILPAVSEELMFRGILQRIFTNMTKNVHWGILISSFLFSAIHLQFYGFFPRWILGILFGYLLIWSGSMWVPILAHFVNNTLAVLAYYFVNTSNLDEKMLDVGTPGDLILSSVIAVFIFSGCLYLFYKQNSGARDIYIKQG